MLQMVGESSIFISGLKYLHIQFLMSTEKTCWVWKDTWNKSSWRRLWSDEKDIPLFCFLVTWSCSMVRMSTRHYDGALHLRWKPCSVTMACTAPQYLAPPSPFNPILPTSLTALQAAILLLENQPSPDASRSIVYEHFYLHVPATLNMLVIKILLTLKIFCWSRF